MNESLVGINLKIFLKADTELILKFPDYSDSLFEARLSIVTKIKPEILLERLACKYLHNSIN